MTRPVVIGIDGIAIPLAHDVAMICCKALGEAATRARSNDEVGRIRPDIRALMRAFNAVEAQYLQREAVHLLQSTATLTSRDVAQRLHKTDRHVRRLAQCGRLPSERNERGHLRFDPAEVESYAGGLENLKI